MRPGLHCYVSWLKTNSGGQGVSIDEPHFAVLEVVDQLLVLLRAHVVGPNNLGIVYVGCVVNPTGSGVVVRAVVDEDEMASGAAVHFGLNAGASPELGPGRAPGFGQRSVLQVKHGRGRAQHKQKDCEDGNGTYESESGRVSVPAPAAQRLQGGEQQSIDNADEGCGVVRIGKGRQEDGEETDCGDQQEETSTGADMLEGESARQGEAEHQDWNRK